MIRLGRVSKETKGAYISGTSPDAAQKCRFNNDPSTDVPVFAVPSQGAKTCAQLGGKIV